VSFLQLQLTGSGGESGYVGFEKLCTQKVTSSAPIVARPGRRRIYITVPGVFEECLTLQ